MDSSAPPPHPSAASDRWRRLPVPVRRAVVTARRLSHASRRPHPNVDVDVIGHVAVATVDDGKVNVLSQRLVQVLSAALDDVESDDRVRAVVLCGRPGQFCAGFNLDTLMIGGRRRDELIRDGWVLVGRLITLPLPVVVACTGNAVAAGAALLLTGDTRLAAEGDFKIGFNEASIGLPLPSAVLTLARDRLTEAAYEEAMYGARMHRPQEALAAGFVHRVVPPVELLGAAIDEARALGDLPAGTFRRDKEARVAPVAEQMRRQLPADLELIKQIGA